MKKLLIGMMIGAMAIVVNAGDKKQITASGKVLCAHCDLSLKSSCQKAIQTTDNKVYLLSGKIAKTFFKENKKVKQITATGSVKEDEGNNILTAKTIAKVEG